MTDVFLGIRPVGFLLMMQNREMFRHSGMPALISPRCDAGTTLSCGLHTATWT
jgi:hypothetical protein